MTALAAVINEGSEHYEGKYFKQTVDIDLTGVAWEPIGYGENADEFYFAGNYDGGNNYIRNITCTGKEKQYEGNPDSTSSTEAIFGIVNGGAISNLHIENANFSATSTYTYSFVGGIAGIAYDAVITNCSVSNSSFSSICTTNDDDCAGSIAGYSAGGIFKNCAAENNKIYTDAYAGGFVGEVFDEEVEAGYKNSNVTSFENCYVQNVQVVAEVEASNSTSYAGGFCGALACNDDGDPVVLKSCYVYRTTAVIEDNGIQSPVRGVGEFLAYSVFPNFNTITYTDSYYGSITLNGTQDSNTPTAPVNSERSADSFANGEVLAQLNSSAFILPAGYEYPILSSRPADYTAVNDAIVKANQVDGTLYTEETYNALVSARDGVVRGKPLAEQEEVNAMATAIENAIANLAYKPADYTKVDAAKAKADALKKDEYLDFSQVEAALNAVDRSKIITQQDEVDAMAKAIEDAIAALQKKATPIPATPTPAPAATAAPTAQPTATIAPTAMAEPVAATSAAVGSIPATGDAGNVTLLWGVLALAGAGFVICHKKRGE